MFCFKVVIVVEIVEMNWELAIDWLIVFYLNKCYLLFKLRIEIKQNVFKYSLEKVQK